MSDDYQIVILSPATREEEFLKWSPCKPGEIRDENVEIIEIIHWLISDIEELSTYSNLIDIFKTLDRSSFYQVSKLCNLYNETITKLWDYWDVDSIKPPFYNGRASREHIQFIIQQCYNRAVSKPDKLNQYPPFSPQVYGETSFELISQMIDTIQITPDDVFIDLGSGVGQVVLQISASCDAKYCYGVEKADYPAACAIKLDSAFRHWMRFYGKSYSPFLLERGDFLSTDYQDRIMSASVLFANNFAFGPEVDHQLKQRFANLKEGARIISSKAFCPLNFRITDRNLSDIGSIMHVSCLNPIQDAVSWTDKPFSYYVHTIDRSLLEQYFARLKNPKSKTESQLIRRDRKGRIIFDGKNNANSMKTTDQGCDDQLTIVTNSIIHHSNSTGRLSKRSASLPDAIHQSNRLSRHRSCTDLTNSSSNLSRTTRPINRTMSTAKQKFNSLPNRSRSWRSAYRKRQPKLSIDRISSTSEGDIKSGLSNLHLFEPDDYAAVSKSSKLLFPDYSESTFTDDYLSGSQLSSNSRDPLHPHDHQQHEDNQPNSRNSSSSPYVSSISSSSNRSPNYPHQMADELSSFNLSNESRPLSLGTTLQPVGNTPRSVEQVVDAEVGIGNVCVENDPTSKDVPHIRIKFKLTSDRNNNDSGDANNKEYIHCGNTTADCVQPVKDGNQHKQPWPNETEIEHKMPTSRDDADDTSVAKRRVIRKCRQLINTDPLVTAPTQFINNSGRVRTKRLTVVISNSNVNSTNNRSSVCKFRRGKQDEITTRINNTTTTQKKKSNPNEHSKHNLDLLHQQTLRQVRCKARSDQTGLNDRKMCSFTQHYQPMEIHSIKDTDLNRAEIYSTDMKAGHNNDPIPLALTQYLELSKQVFMDHFKAIRSPAYYSTLRAQLEKEQVRQTELLRNIKTLDQSIAKLHTDGANLLNRFTKRLGILITTPAAFFAQARKLIKHHHILEDKIKEFRKQITELTTANQDLVRRHQLEAARLLAVATSQQTSATRTDKCSPEEVISQSQPVHHRTHHHHHHRHHRSRNHHHHHRSESVSNEQQQQQQQSQPSFNQYHCENGRLNYSSILAHHSIPPPPALTKLSSSSPTTAYPTLTATTTTTTTFNPTGSCPSIDSPLPSSSPSTILTTTTTTTTEADNNNNNKASLLSSILNNSGPTLNNQIDSTNCNSNMSDDLKASFHSGTSICTGGVAALVSSRSFVAAATTTTSTVCSSIPPPPPLLPMRVSSPSGNSHPQVTSFRKTILPGMAYLSAEISSPNNTVNNTSLTSSSMPSSYLGTVCYGKSLHASLQDLIFDELTRTTPFSVATVINPIVTLHSNLSHPTTRTFRRSAPTCVTLPTTSCTTTVSNEQLTVTGQQLPPRKRQWSGSSGEAHHRDCVPSRKHLKTIGDALKPQLTGNNNNNNNTNTSTDIVSGEYSWNFNRNLSPPTLSPVPYDDYCEYYNSSSGASIGSVPPPLQTNTITSNPTTTIPSEDSRSQLTDTVSNCTTDYPVISHCEQASTLQSHPTITKYTNYNGALQPNGE